MKNTKKRHHNTITTKSSPWNWWSLTRPRTSSTRHPSNARSPAPCSAVSTRCTAFKRRCCKVLRKKKKKTSWKVPNILSGKPFMIVKLKKNICKLWDWNRNGTVKPGSKNFFEMILYWLYYVVVFGVHTHNFVGLGFYLALTWGGPHKRLGFTVAGNATIRDIMI